MYSNTEDLLTDFDTTIGKIEDAGAVVRGGGIDRYWQRENIKVDADTHKLFNEKPKHKWLFDSNLALAHFDLRSIEFGNWMSQQDRVNFLYGAMLSLHHLAQLLGVSDSQIGMKGKLSIALGARGHGKAMAHYEPNPWAVINITKTMGIGSLVHEYAHAIDNLLSFYTGGRQQAFVSGGDTIRIGFSETIAKKGNYFEKQFEDFYNRLYFDKKGEKTSFIKAVSAQKSDYWQRRNEVFARTFEVYTHYKLKDKGIKNHFLADSSYKSKVYPSEQLMLQVAPIINKITKKAFQLFKTNKPLNGIVTATGYKGFRVTLLQNANVNDTLENMQRIAYRDKAQVAQLAKALEGASVGETAENIWNYLRDNTRYKLDQAGIEELRTPARSLVDGGKGIADTKFGIDCDDYTILISALLLNLRIKHEYRVTAYKDKGKFQHIYPVAFDNMGQAFVIDVVPEIPHFNYEAKPIIDLKTIPMELHELSGIEDTITDTELKNDLLEDLNAPFTLSGISDNDYEDEDELLESEFLAGFGEVENEDEADIVLNGTADAIQLIENGILAEVNKAKQTLLKERTQPTVLSQTINVSKELALMNAIIKTWQNDDMRHQALERAIVSGSSYANFYKAITMSLSQLERQDLQGVDDEDFDTPIYLARVDMEAFKLENLLEEDEDEDTDDLAGRASRRRRRRRRRRKRGGLFKRIFKGIGKGIKKVVKAVVRFNPASIVIRAAIRLVLKTNLFKIASRLIYGFLTEKQAQEQGLDLGEWRKLVRAKNRAEKFYTKIGGKASKFRKAIVRGKAAKKTGLQLGAVATGGTAAASGFIVFVKKILKAINPAKLFKKVIDKIKKKKQEGTTAETPPFVDNGFNDFPEQTTTMKTAQAPTKPKTFKEKVKAFLVKHKKKLIVVGVSGVLVIVAVVVYNKSKKKKKRSLAGIKAARTRARNRKRALSGVPTPRRLPQGRTLTRRTPQLKGRTPSLKGAKSNGNRLKAMHAKAKQLQKKHPRTKYSTLLKKAATMI